MHLLTLTVTLLFTSTTFSEATELPVQDQRSLKIPRVRNLNFVPNGPSAKQQIFHKFGWTTIPDTHEKFSNVVPQTGKAAAVPVSNHAQYLSPVTIGGQTFNMAFDTGSSDLWVFSTYLPAEMRRQHQAFDTNASSTFRFLPGSTWQIRYGDATGAQGVVGLDVVSIGGVSSPNQAIQLATSVTQEFVDDSGCDGLLGLGFSIINTIKPQPQNTFFDNVKASLAMPTFAVNLEEDGSGFYEFGTIDASQYVAPLKGVPIDNTLGLWGVDSPCFTIGNGERMSDPGRSRAIVDTGTSLLVVDDVVARMYYAKIPTAVYSHEADGYIFPCSITPPQFTVALGTEDFNITIPGRLINFAQVSSTHCYGGIQSNEGNRLQIYGDILLRSAYVVFGTDYPVSGLAIAAKANPATSKRNRRSPRHSAARTNT